MNDSNRFNPIQNNDDIPVDLKEEKIEVEETKIDFPIVAVELPSWGEVYPVNHPFYKKKNIEIKEMTAQEEDILTSKSLIKKGIVLDRLMKSILLDKVNPEKITIGDRNAILLAARINGLGPEYSAKIVCPACDTRSNFDYDLNKAVIKDYKEVLMYIESKDVELSIDSPGVFSLILPKTKANIKFRLLTGEDEKYIQEVSKNNKNALINEENFTLQLRRSIIEVNGKKDAATLLKFTKTVPMLDTRFFKVVYTACSPDIVLKTKWECPSCGVTEEDIVVPYGTEFFWPK
ncbi:hypothetical protein M0R19_04165 [Candidatus Pacearchaeota archaeon]|jgi:hypothetical protein|nr:hypothetical protein [Candidatus Pacearchaeota archaeon]